jgi:hypothetical protein
MQEECLDSLALGSFSELVRNKWCIRDSTPEVLALPQRISSGLSTSALTYEVCVGSTCSRSRVVEQN